MKLKIRILRYNPEGTGTEIETDVQGQYLQAYKVDVVEGMTVLEVLLNIADTEDPTLGFRRSCRSAICGSCAVRINGTTKLACNTQVLPLYRRDGDILVEPIANHPVTKDLMVDFTQFWRKLGKVSPFLLPAEELAGGGLGPGGGVRAQGGAGAEGPPVVTREDAAVIDKSQQCIMCGCCNSECNAMEIDERYAGPAALAKAWRFVGDVREGNRYTRLVRLSVEHGIWACVRCVHCTQYCPKGVEPLKQIEMLRSTAISEGITDNFGAKHVEAMTNSVKKIGRLDEAAMTFKTLGYLRSLGMIPLGIRMKIHGKMPMLHIFPQIDGIKEVRGIYNEFVRRRRDERKKG
jgi:succinate dehydrogenase / fumarate reductase iron-sulfur subunit